MSRKTTTRKRPRKADLLAALREFTHSVRHAGGIQIVEATEHGTRKATLDRAYIRACRLIGEQPAPVTKDADDYESAAIYLLGKYYRLVQLAEDRGYSTRALVALIMSAAMAEEIQF